MTTTTNARDQLRAVLKLAEGTGPMRNGRMLPYRDCCGKVLAACHCTTPGQVTIGWGRNLEANGLSISEGELLLEHDIDEAIKVCVAAFPWFVALDPVRQATLTELAFNLGLGHLLQFRRMLSAAQRGDWTTAGQELADSAQARAAVARYARLRRQLETGAW